MENSNKEEVEPVVEGAPEGEGAQVASEGEGAPAASEGEGAPAAVEGEGAPAAVEGEGAPAAVEGEGAPVVEGEGAPAAVEEVPAAAPQEPVAEEAPVETETSNVATSYKNELFQLARDTTRDQKEVTKLFENRLKMMGRHMQESAMNMREDSTGEHILMAAVRSHNVPLTKYLVRKGANVNGLDKKRNTALVHLLLSVSGEEDKRPIQITKILFSKHVNLKRTFSYEGKRTTIPQMIAALPQNSVLKKIKELVEKHLRKSVKKHKSKPNDTKKIASCIQTCTKKCLTPSSKRRTARNEISETEE